MSIVCQEDRYFKIIGKLFPRRFNKADVQPALSLGLGAKIVVAAIWQVKDGRR